MIKSKNYKQGSSEWVMAKFFDCWKRRAWKQMLDYVQPSWLHQYKDPSRMLRMILNKLVSAEFVQVNANTGVVAVFAMKVFRETYSVIGLSYPSVKLVREGKKWAVDPRSLI